MSCLCLFVCLYLIVFDVLFYNGQSWMEKPLRERRHLLESELVEVRSEIKIEINYQKDISLFKCFQSDLRGWQ